MGSDSILPQTPTALLVVEEQVGSTRAIYLHMFQLPKNRIALEHMHDHPCVPREHGRVGLTRAIGHCHFQHQAAKVSPVPSPTSANALDSQSKEKCRASSNGMYSPWLSGEYISPESLCLLGSITGVQQLTIVTCKYNL